MGQGTGKGGGGRGGEGKGEEGRGRRGEREERGGGDSFTVFIGIEHYVSLTLGGGWS